MVISAQAFTTLQSAKAHNILFFWIFEIAREDTSMSIFFFYIHGTGIESVITDGHQGQALGIFFFFNIYIEKKTKSFKDSACFVLTFARATHRYADTSLRD